MSIRASPSNQKQEDCVTTQTILPRSGTAFVLRKGQRLTVIDPQGQQVSDLVAFNAEDTEE